MRDQIQDEDYELWDIITDGSLSTLKKNVEGVDVPKTRVDCHAEDLKKWEKNAKAKKWLICGLSLDEYNRIQGFSTAKQTWDTLQVDHEGTTQVKRSRGTLLYSQYDKFAMRDGEIIQEMYTIFTTLINELKSLGNIIPKDERVDNILPITWESKITAIQQSKKMDVPKKERSLALRITEGSELEDDEMTMITKTSRST
ncbi:uncharacterized protein [Nicotiana tomentosiformis]|uniref:uncharacterized protein n=1 Tax=Nicotiana tomentosiformis TaxID=4098 RepID=UPI00388C6A92